MTLKIFTLGGLSIQLNDQPVGSFVSRKVEALLVYLACERREHPREMLASLFWDDLPQTRAMGNLRTSLWSLQNQLGDYLTVTRQSVMMNTESRYWIDIHELENALNIAERISGDLPRQIQENLQAALTFFHGDFLVGFHVREARGFEEWVRLEAEQLHHKVIKVHQRLIHDALARGNYADGIEQTQRLLAIDPLSEETHRNLMLLLARSGQRSRAMSQYELCVRLLRNELDVTPEAETVRLYNQIQTETFTETLISPIAVKNVVRLPIPATPFINRPAEFQQITARLDNPDCRLLTLVGPGGIGKTRLALQSAYERVHHFPDGVYFVGLASVEAGDSLAIEIANSLQFAIQSSKAPYDELIEYLKSRKLLLVLDNFEHLINEADLVSDILIHAPDVRILVTSRIWLNLQQEWVLPIEGMAWPTTVSVNIHEFSAVQLFNACAQRIQPRFRLDDDPAAVIRICQLVEGMPLSIELAASWLRVMSCDQIANEIDRNLDILQSPLRNLPERHRSIRATFNTSWALLSTTERQLLLQLSVFQGSFPQVAAQRITQASVLTLRGLQDKSLLSADSGYYDLHPLLRQFSAEKFSAYPDEKMNLQMAHSNYYAERLTFYQLRFNANFLTETVRELAREFENIRSAWNFAILQRDLPLANKFLKPLYNYFDIQSHYYEGETIFRWAYHQSLSTGGAPTETFSAQLRVLQGSMFVCMGQYADGQLAIQDNLVILQRGDFPWETRIGLASLATIAYVRGNYLESWAYYDQAMPYYERAGDIAEIINLSVRLADIATVLGEYQKARQILIEKRPFLEQLRGQRGRISFLNTLGDLEYKLGNYGSAKQCFTESLRFSEEMQDSTGLGVALVSLGRTAYALGAYTESIALCAQSIALCKETHNQWGLSFAVAQQGRAYHILGLYQDALKAYSTAIAICQEMGNRWVMSFTLRQLSRSNIALNHLDEASDNAFSALEIASKIQATPLILDALVGIAALMHKRNHTDEALMIALFIDQNPISEHETRLEAAALAAVLQIDSAPVVFPEKFGQADNVDTIIERVSALRSVV